MLPTKVHEKFWRSVSDFSGCITAIFNLLTFTLIDRYSNHLRQYCLDLRLNPSAIDCCLSVPSPETCTQLGLRSIFPRCRFDRKNLKKVWFWVNRSYLGLKERIIDRSHPVGTSRRYIKTELIVKSGKFNRSTNHIHNPNMVSLCYHY